MHFRRKLEDELTLNFYNERVKHSIRIVLGGGVELIDHLSDELKQKNPLPVIFVRGSGGVADIIAYAYSIHKRDTPILETENPHGYKVLQQLVEERFPLLDDEEVARVYKSVIDIVSQEHISIYGSEEKEDPQSFHEFILEAILDDFQVSPTGMILLTMLWNKVEVARRKIPEARIQPSVSDLEFHLRSALQNNKPGFVNLFLDMGWLKRLILLNFDTRRFIKDLYKKSQQWDNSFLKIYKKEKNLEKVDMEVILGMLYNDCLCYVDRDAMVNKKGGILELFLWAVISNLPNMMHVLYLHGEDFTRKALIGECASKLMIRIGEKHRMLDDIISQYKKNEEKFHLLAVCILNECYNDNEELTRELVMYDCSTDTSRTKKTVTSLEIAAAVGNEEFVAHSSCQYLLNLRWGGKLKLEEDRRFQFFLTFVCCILIPPLILFQRFQGVTEDTDESGGVRVTDGETNILFKTGKNLRIWLSKFRAFFDAPVSKFYANVVSYALFLGLFTFMITRILPKNPDTLEWLMLVWIIALAWEELMQVVRYGFKSWVSSYWNIWDAVVIILFLLGFGLRMRGLLIDGRIAYAIDLMLFIVRILEMFYVDKKLGPYVVMIGRMTYDLMNFISIVLVFMFAYGVGRDVILNPESDRSLQAFGERLLVPYFEMYGELFIGYPQQNSNETVFSTTNYSSSVQPLVICIMAVYLLVANVLLLNILIAVFNNTYKEVQEKADVIWKYRRYHLIHDYQQRVFLPPPFSLPLNVYQLLLFIFTYIRDYKEIKSTTKDCSRQGKERMIKKHQRIMYFEERCLNKIRHSNLTVLLGTVEDEKAKISNRTENMSTVLSLGSENQKQIFQLKENIIVLKSNQESIEALLKRVIENQNKINENIAHIRKNTRSVNEDLSRLPEDHTHTGKENPLLAGTQTSLEECEGAAFPHVSKILLKGEDQTDENKTVRKSPVKSVNEESLLEAPLVSTLNVLHVENKEERGRKQEKHEEIGTTRVEYQNILSRSAIYPISDVERLHVPDQMVPWQVDMPTYDPPKYTALLLAASSKWTDKEILNEDSSSFKFNDVDWDIDRTSYQGYYQVINGMPRNPVGRTGLKGRGILGRYGPNHMCTAIFTRVQCGGKILEVLVIPAKGKKGLTFPEGGIFDFNNWGMPGWVTRFFNEITLIRIGMSETEAEKCMDTFITLVQKKVKIFEGYLDNEYNTDNAWLETVAYNFHDEQNVIKNFLLAENNYNMHWRKISEIEKLGTSCGLPMQLRDWLRKVSKLRQ